MDDSIATRRWSLDDQQRFADVSGDRNPLHLDPVAARRTPAGACSVHGMHLLLWALDELAAHGPGDPIGGVRVAFRSFVRVGDAVTLRVSRRGDGGGRGALLVDGARAVTIDVAAVAGEAAGVPATGAPHDIPAIPMDRDWDQIEGARGTVELPAANARDAAAMFPHASRAIGAERVAALARLSAIVGMIVPGLHSIFSSLDVVWSTPARPHIDYAVAAVDARFALVEIRVDGGGVAGIIGAFRRTPPAAAPRLADVAEAVTPGEFSGTTSLIVGGSRGLGAVAATALVAGGGRVVLTYAAGAGDALALAAELGAGQAHALRYDAREPAAPQLAPVDEHFDHVYYFASPTIFRPRGGWFAAERFHELCRFYVDGLAELVETLRQRSPALPLGVFYPSTVFAERPPRELIEYALAKRAGEELCAHLARCDPGVRPVVVRLPRLATDQNTGSAALEAEPPLPVLLPSLRAMRAAVSASASPRR